MKLLKLRYAFLGIAACALPSTASAQLMYFDNQADFQAAAIGAGHALLGVETFEESNLAPHTIDSLNDPLQSGVANLGNFTGQGFVNGLSGLGSLIIQSNAGSFDSETRQPQGAEGLAVLSAGFDGNTSDIVIGNILTNATDIIFSGPGVAATGGNLLAFSPYTNALRIDIYDTNEAFIDRVDVVGDQAGTNFFGVITTDPFTMIGRINVFQFTGAEGMDNIEVWGAGATTPEPGTMIALAAGSLALLSRRRRK